MHHIFVDENCISLSDKKVRVTKNDDFENYNHLANALRIKENELVLCSVSGFKTSFDYKTRVEEVNANEIILGIEENVESRELPITINLYQGISKSDKLELIIEKAVELGASNIIPLKLENCVAKIDESDKSFNKKLERYNKISKSAAEQSKRSIVPEVLKPVDFKNLSKFTSNANAYNILFYENEEGIDKTRKTLSEIRNKSNKDTIINVFIGPEGGFTEKEIDEAKNNNFYILSLGKRILRTETAAFAAITIIAYEFEY